MTDTDDTTDEQTQAEPAPDVEVDLRGEDATPMNADDNDAPPTNGDRTDIDAELIMDPDAPADEDVAPPEEPVDPEAPVEESADLDADDFEDEFGVTEDRLRDVAAHDAKQALESIDAEEPSELVEGAVDVLRERHTETLQQLQQANSTKQQLEQQREGLTTTVEYLRGVAEDEDRLVIKTMPGGVAGELYQEERTEIADEYEEKCGELDGQAEQMAQRVIALKQELKKIEFAYQELQDPKGVLSEVVAGSLTNF